jgi:hypothetical protein
VKGHGRSGERDADGGADDSRFSSVESVFVDWLQRFPRPSESDFAQLCRKHPRLREGLTRIWRGLRRYEAFRAEILGPLSTGAPRLVGRRGPLSLAKAAAALVLVGLAIWYWPVREGLETTRACVAAIAANKSNVDATLASVTPQEAEAFLASAESVRAGRER